MPAPGTVELDAQYRLLREEAGTLSRSAERVVAVSGPDGAEYLQGQLTNDVEALEAGDGCYALLLDRKGKIRVEMRVLRLEPDRIWLLTPESTLGELVRHLETYSIGREVAVEVLDGLGVLSLIGPRSAELLGERLGAEHSHRSTHLGQHEVRAVATDLGADLIAEPGPLTAVAEALAAQGAEQVDPEAAEILRVESGRPRFGAEIGNDTIPQEAGLNERAVSFEKGCYIGQETVARLHYKGRPNRHLRRLRSERPLESGAPVMLDGKELGRVGTAVLSPAEGALALAVLRREAEPGAAVAVGDGLSATVEEIGA